MDTCSNKLLLSYALLFNQPFLSVANTQEKESFCDIAYIEMAEVILYWNQTHNNFQN